MAGGKGVTKKIRTFEEYLNAFPNVKRVYDNLPPKTQREWQEKSKELFKENSEKEKKKIPIIVV